MIPHVITSSHSAVLVLKKLLGPELAGKVRLKNGGNWDGAVTQTSSRMVNRLDIALVIGPSKKPSANQREYDKLRVYGFLRHTPLAALLRVFFLRTPPEGLLFLDPDIIRQLVGREPTPEQFARARMRPRKVLAELLEVKPARVATALRPRLEKVDLTPLLSSVPDLRRLRKFVGICVRRYEARLAREVEDFNKTV
ncbi:hypothetical protein JY651_00245 [Pyxidicoccus parkwayensis]|uniref:Uncharacterized protein n=1 Tax=Pyxidicoccus parkwayensis TaxID=2813578 RepID=A0ABX7P2F9_9BACT|nr:hypothetical protein [Pyxidicoccus parkwaysis]QSQ23453.1 hypothetical protein JY651_00245 [Pyxidicoccus parkwaysis]